MLSGIGSWKNHENSGRFVGSKPRAEADKPIFVVTDTGEHYAATVDLAVTTQISLSGVSTAKCTLRLAERQFR